MSSKRGIPPPYLTVILSDDNDKEQLLDDNTCSEQSFCVAVQLDHPMVLTTPVGIQHFDIYLLHFTPTLLVSLATEEDE